MVHFYLTVEITNYEQNESILDMFINYYLYYEIIFYQKSYWCNSNIQRNTKYHFSRYIKSPDASPEPD